MAVSNFFIAGILAKVSADVQIRYDQPVMGPSPDAVYESVRDALDPSLRPLFSREFVVCSEWFDRFTTETVSRDLMRLGLAEEFDTPRFVEDVMAAKSFAPRAAVSLRWMLEKLTAEGFFEVEEAGNSRRYRRRSPLPANPDEFRQKALDVDSRCAPAFAVVEELSAHIQEFFRGEKTGEEILFSLSKLSLWFDYFNNSNLLYAINNILGAEAVTRVLPATRPAAVLELGGGAGSAALALLERLERDATTSRIGRYHFTEFVPAFLRRGERALKERFAGVPLEAKKLNMNEPFEPQGFPDASFDLVYAVNTLHVAHALVPTLRRVFDVLKPGGRIVLSECLRPVAGQPIYLEFIFNFLENFVGVETDPETRPTHGFLTPANWRAALSRAGFEGVEILPDVEELSKQFPSFFVGAVLARKPA